MVDRDNAGAIAPPPLLALGVIVFGAALDWLLPAYVLSLLLALTERIVIGAVLMAAGLALAIPARGAFVSAGTNVEPWKALHRPCHRRHLRQIAQSDVCRRHSGAGRLGHRAGVGLDAGADDRLRPGDPFRRGQARGALSPGQVRRAVPALYGQRAAIRLAVLSPKSGGPWHRSPILLR